MADIDYYEGDEAQWGSYQYITLENIINNYLMSRDADDYTSNSPRTKVLYQARRGMREFYYDVLQEVKGIELDLPPTLTITLPPDYVNYVRISWVDSSGKLHPMAMDNRLSIAKEYLQDQDYKLLFDDDGCVLIGEGDDEPVEEGNDPDADVGSNYNYSYSFCNGGFQPNRNMSNFYANGSYRIDKSRGIIQFGSEVKGKSVVLEYISDGLYSGCEGRAEDEIRINKFAEAALLDFIYYQLIKNRRNIPYNEKMRARKEFYNSHRIAKRRINALKKSEVIQAFRGQSKWIK